MRLNLPPEFNNSRIPREFSQARASEYLGPRCLQCLEPLPLKCRANKRFCCRPCHSAWWRRMGGVRVFERVRGQEALERVMRVHVKYMFGWSTMDGWRTAARDLPFIKTRRERIAARKKAERALKARGLPDPSGFTWSQYKALIEERERAEKATKKAQPVVRKKRRHGSGCRYKPMGKPPKPVPHEITSPPLRGSHWAA
jgi:hypothetical protein